ncbi:MAG: hypothetical protein A2745_01920 [Candidatus Harrisonbacteria bacterium RIFCSPHIGHO2_01_FULL_44_13]|uniref:Carbohydrate kinase PfkB domain-containing protein n=1 Tax=Candidatus Harrisonbacteria bacterium RIFCSPLOWO2_01_FULL_44_18 TaxID=1798407 RepID=A0A1G1ZNR3_9BACT|nr:MAG: hypothetical protein A2745_01920 [Candidatus Harrisonbacteria bacterium RIFCSPHIGHO2_01_FULL_44_13]OGY66318.1 MAG: hypothetical protein A3A16_00195 [Candidatus Harrisonbacteria bacterium RIFCSPLOWO2_01_FULL_44_18]
MPDVIAIGSATRDNFLKADYKIIDWPETPLKKAIVLPFGEKVGVDEVYFTIGGNAANASVTFSRQGFKTACVAKIGDDLPGKDFLARLKRERVNTKLISESKDGPTAYSALLLKNGERTILSHHGASDTFSLEDVNLKKLRSRWWYLSLSGESDSMYLDLLRFAKKNSIKVAFNPSGHHIKHKRQEVLKSLKDLAILVLNAGEAAELIGISFEKEKEVFKKLDEMTPGIIAVTDGPRGVTVSDGENLYKAGIFPEKQLVDRTGAGDAFGSGFVAGLLRCQLRTKNLEPRTDDIKYAIRLASANATSVVEHIGATEGTLTREQFEQDPRWQEFKIEVKSLDE